MKMARSVSERHLSQLSAFVAARIGLHFPRERWRDLERGVNSAARELDFGDSESYIEWLVSSSLTRSQIEGLASHLTVGETYFFRDRRVFQVLEKLVLPKLIHSRRRESGKHLRIWSAGCATGEEPYSIAILLSKMVLDRHDWNITIQATDINPRFLHKAADGLYGNWSFRDMPPGIKEKFFKPAGDGRFEILPQIKNMVTFAYLNLAEDSYPSLFNNTNAMDVIFCRNVLMYFAPERTKKVVHNLHRSLVDGGWLVASPGEASHVLFSQFATLDSPGTILYRKEKQPCPATSGFSCKPFEEAPGSFTSAVAFAPNSHVGTTATNHEYTTKPDPRELPQDLYREASALYEGGCYAEAVEKAASLLAQNPTNTGGMTLLARVYANLGKLDEALEWCDRAIAAEKLNAGTHYLMATILQELDRTEVAMLSLKRALYIDPNLVLAHVALGNLSRQCGKHKESVKHFENALSLLTAKRPEDVVPESEGMRAGRLIEIIRSTASET